MADDSCCNLRCFSYFVAVLTIVGAILQLLQFSPQSIIGGLIGIALGCLLVAGIRKEKENYVLAYVIIEAVLLLILLILCIVALTSFAKIDLEDDKRRILNAFLYANVAGVVVGYLLLIPVFLFYKQLGRKHSQELPPAYKA